MSRSLLSQISRTAYKVSKVAATGQAVKRGRLPQVLARRAERRYLWRGLKKMGL
jgi:hypothetical protein